MAHKKGAGSSRNGRESESKRLGVKIFGGQKVVAGNIIVRQRGTKHHPGRNVGIGKDHTLFALIDGHVSFAKKANKRSFVSVNPFVDTLVEERLDVKEAKPKKVKEEIVEAKTEETEVIKTEDAVVEEVKKSTEKKAEKPEKKQTKKPASETKAKKTVKKDKKDKSDDTEK